jgi:hypothetical protein
VPAIGAPALAEPRLLTAEEAAIAVPAITGRAEKKQGAAFATHTKPLS